MGSVTRRIKRNMIENKYGYRMSLKRAKKKIAELEEKIAKQTNIALDSEKGSVDA